MQSKLLDEASIEYKIQLIIKFSIIFQAILIKFVPVAHWANVSGKRL